jgi:hypothetical protein
MPELMLSFAPLLQCGRAFAPERTDQAFALIAWLCCSPA